VEKTKYYSGIKRYIASRIGNHHDAEDLSQSVFLEFYRSNNGGDDIQNSEAYLVGIYKNLITRYCHEKQKQPITIPIATMEEDCSIRKKRDYVDQLRMQKLKETLRKSLEQLPPRDYETIRLCLLGDLSVKETAQRARVPVSVFYKRYQRALKTLRKISIDILGDDFGNS
jgi:RNA polymerase sigma factor (sigma-70 family)